MTEAAVTINRTVVEAVVVDRASDKPAAIVSRAAGAEVVIAREVVALVNGGGQAARYIHTQSAPSASWTVNHNLAVQPAAVTVLSPGGMEILAEIVHVSVNQLLVLFASPQTGKAVVV